MSPILIQIVTVDQAVIQACPALEEIDRGPGQSSSLLEIVTPQSNGRSSPAYPYLTHVKCRIVKDGGQFIRCFDHRFIYCKITGSGGNDY